MSEPMPITNDQADPPSCDRDKLICPLAWWTDKEVPRLRARVAELEDPHFLKGLQARVDKAESRVNLLEVTEDMYRTLALRHEARIAELEGALRPLADAADREAALQRHRARDATSGVARALIELARKWEALRDAARAVLNAPANATTQAAIDVLAERHRQIVVEGWTADHDDAHQHGALALAAAAYTEHACKTSWHISPAGDSYPNFPELGPNDGAPPKWWPWARKWWKPKNFRRDLVRAAALIIAEIERFDRQCNAPANATESEVMPNQSATDTTETVARAEQHNATPRPAQSPAGAEAMREAILQALPGGTHCDPQEIADMIRAIPAPAGAVTDEMVKRAIVALEPFTETSSLAVLQPTSEDYERARAVQDELIAALDAGAPR